MKMDEENTFGWHMYSFYKYSIYHSKLYGFYNFVLFTKLLEIKRNKRLALSRDRHKQYRRWDIFYSSQLLISPFPVGSHRVYKTFVQLEDFILYHSRLFVYVCKVVLFTQDFLRRRKIREKTIH